VKHFISISKPSVSTAKQKGPNNDRRLPHLQWSPAAAALQHGGRVLPGLLLAGQPVCPTTGQRAAARVKAQALTAAFGAGRRAVFMACTHIPPNFTSMIQAIQYFAYLYKMPSRLDFKPGTDL
jgi:hypothetical protein